MQAWNQIKSSNDITQYETFIKNHPNSPHGEEAERKMEEIDWQSLNKDAAWLRGFLSRHPNGAHFGDARNRLAVLEKAQDEERRREEEKRAVLAVLKAYEDASNRMNADEMAQIYPGVAIATVRKAFKDDRSYGLSLAPETPKIGNNNTASVRCLRLVRETPIVGRPQQREDRVTIELRKDSGHWLIERIIN
jgi:hypothetical protein